MFRMMIIFFFRLDEYFEGLFEMKQTFFQYLHTIQYTRSYVFPDNHINKNVNQKKTALFVCLLFHICISSFLFLSLIIARFYSIFSRIFLLFYCFALYYFSTDCSMTIYSCNWLAST